jgi:hypothetical protein
MQGQIGSNGAEAAQQLVPARRNRRPLIARSASEGSGATCHFGTMRRIAVEMLESLRHAFGRDRRLARVAPTGGCWAAGASNSALPRHASPHTQASGTICAAPVAACSKLTMPQPSLDAVFSPTSQAL